ncbi:tRNA-specific adenosine deaminase [Candidatus Blochmanniella vafra str. BVAF]|uniref:tRNA-specific adenosine deaminase n=1 Tax=Blochmanniella vafra (strain BVAF) TaxID=859654 RepID=E8Q6F2_BLOVB|nr:tRNA adenosine(34) deaminase TadA [Candidatus Blochmannia vafer]ADV33921.1 tRNA-specific adenosine deaminase [Candidatus Blochmannia vafer str. BVAF]
MFDLLDMDIIWMRYAITLASVAALSGNVAIGAVLVYDGRLVGYGYNAALIFHDPSAHAEIIALRVGGNYLGNYRLLNTTLYVTMEPCIMCVGAIINARIHRLVCGAIGNKIRWINLLRINYFIDHAMINHQCDIKTGVLSEVCSKQIRDFFKYKR